MKTSILLLLFMSLPFVSLEVLSQTLENNYRAKYDSDLAENLQAFSGKQRDEEETTKTFHCDNDRPGVREEMTRIQEEEREEMAQAISSNPPGRGRVDPEQKVIPE